MKIVVRVPNWIGDVVFALPALRGLDAHFAGSDLRLAGPAWTADLLSGTEFAGRTITLGGAGKPEHGRGPAAALKAEGFETGILLTNSFASALLFRRAGIAERWGYRGDARSFLLTRPVRRKKAVPPIHMVHYYLQLLEGLGIPAPPPSIDLSVSPAAQERASRRLAELRIETSRPLVLLAPGAAHGPAKRWPAARFADAARLLHSRFGAAAAVIGTKADSPLAAEIVSASASPPADLTGRTDLGELLGLMARASVLITNDSGPLHMANALRVPVVAVFGPTDPRATGPFHRPSRTLKQEGIPCAPCRYRECPYDHRCMTRITAEDAARAAGEILR